MENIEFVWAFLQERGVFKEANLNKKRDESIADKGSLPVFLFPSTSVNKTQVWFPLLDSRYVSNGFETCFYIRTRSC